MASPRRRWRSWLRHGVVGLLALVWLTWLLLAVPDGGRKQYGHPLNADQLVAAIREGAVAAIITQDANTRVDIVYADERPVTSAHLPTGTRIDDMLRPYDLSPAISSTVRLIAIPREPFTLADWLAVLRSYWLPPLIPPLLAASLGFLLYNIVKTLLFFVGLGGAQGTNNA